MNHSEQAYEFNILKFAINKYLDKNFQKSQKDLQILESNKDEIVWDIVSTIYTQSGYKVSMTLARDIVDQRIKDTEDKLKEDEEKAHQEMIAFQEMMKIEAEKEQARQQLLRIQAEEEKAKQEKIKLERKRKLNKIIDSLPKEINFDETKLDIFVRVYKLCCEYFNFFDSSNENHNLEVEKVFHKNEIFMTIVQTKIFTTALYQGDFSSFTRVSWTESDKFHTYKEVLETSSGDSLDAIELVMALEEEFDIEITDSESKQLVFLKDIVDFIYTKITN